MAQLEFTLANNQGSTVLFITEDQAVNTLTLSIKNVSGKPLTLEGGAPVAEGSIGKKPAAIYITLGDLVDATHLKDLKITADGWEPKFFTGGLTNWGISPVNTITVAHGSSLTFKIEKIVPVAKAKPGNFTVDYFNLGTLPKNSTGIPVTVQNLPTEHAELKLNHGIMGSSYINVSTDGKPEIKNSITFYLSNPSHTQPIVPDKKAWGKNKPVFNLYFAYGGRPGYTELCTLDQLRRMNVEMAAVYTDTWKPVPLLQGSDPYWELQPQDHDILAAGGTIMFNITNIVTYLEPGPTMLFLQYAYIPGYDDGVMAINLFKRLPPPTIDDFHASPPSVNIGESFELTWNTYGGDYTLIQEFGGKVEASASKTVQVTSGAQTELNYHMFCARGTPAAPVDQVTRQCQVNVNPPAIHLFKVSATEMALFGLVEITWSVSSVESCQLMMGETPIGHGLWGTISIRIAEDTTFTLVCKGTSEVKQAKTVKVQPIEVAAFTAVWTPDQKQAYLDQIYGKYIRAIYPQWDGNWDPWMAYALENAGELFTGTLTVAWNVKFAALVGITGQKDQEIIHLVSPVYTVEDSAKPADTGTKSYHGQNLSSGSFFLSCYGKGGQYHGLVLMEAQVATPPKPHLAAAEMELVESFRELLLAEKTS